MLMHQVYAVDIYEEHHLHGPAHFVAYSIWEIYFTIGKAEHNVKQADRSARKPSKNIKKRKKKGGEKR